MDQTTIEQVKVKWLKPHARWAYCERNICDLPSDKVQELLEGEFVEILPDDYQEKIPGRKILPEEDMIVVIWLKPHILFSYNAGDQGKVTPENFAMLQAGGFVEPLTRNKPKGKSFLDKIKLR
jgi:hypothetical protein